MTDTTSYIRILITLTCTLIAGCSVIRSVVPIDEVIASDFAVTQEWQEIRPPTPMTSSHQSQMIVLTVDGAKLPEAIDNQAANTTKIDWNSLAFPDGKLITPELELIDAEGVAHRLHGSQESGRGRGYSVDSSENAKNMSGRTFVALKIRSNIPFRAKEIRWYTFDRK